MTYVCDASGRNVCTWKCSHTYCSRVSRNAIDTQFICGKRILWTLCNLKIGLHQRATSECLVGACWNRYRPVIWIKARMVERQRIVDCTGCIHRKAHQPISCHNHIFKQSNFSRSIYISSVNAMFIISLEIIQLIKWNLRMKETLSVHNIEIDAILYFWFEGSTEYIQVEMEMQMWLLALLKDCLYSNPLHLFFILHISTRHILWSTAAQ